MFTDKGHGVPQAVADPVAFHSPSVFETVDEQWTTIALKKGGSARAYTDAMSTLQFMLLLANDPKAVVLTAAMCQGNKLEQVRD